MRVLPAIPGLSGMVHVLRTSRSVLGMRVRASHGSRFRGIIRCGVALQFGRPLACSYLTPRTSPRVVQRLCRRPKTEVDARFGSKIGTAAGFGAGILVRRIQLSYLASYLAVVCPGSVPLLRVAYTRAPTVRLSSTALANRHLGELTVGRERDMWDLVSRIRGFQFCCLSVYRVGREFRCSPTATHCPHRGRGMCGN